jgi:hypothetical protein
MTIVIFPVESIVVDVLLTHKDHICTLGQPKAARKNFEIQACFPLVEVSPNVY